ncbi:MAG: HEPN domain-containing protein [Defluviitaleaceae bacterium]|nr:HEPN domain-containing protein [Defluviitaleaceae bacterium]
MSDKASYWLDTADEDLITARALLSTGRLLHAGFFCHLIAEKALKAVIADRTNKIPPKIHALRRLAEEGMVLNELSDEQIKLLRVLTPLHINARYPEYKKTVKQKLSTKVCKQLLHETEEFLCWIKRQLGR